MKKLLFFAAVAAFSFSSCSKTGIVQQTVNTENVAGTYKIVSASSTVYGSTTATTDRLNNADMDYNFWSDCEKDDLYTLASDGTFNYTDAGKSCSTNGSFQGNWSLIDKSIKVSYTYLNNMTVSSLTSKNMTLTETVTTGSSKYEISIVLARQ
jgi:hypothetical protein